MKYKVREYISGSKYCNEETFIKEIIFNTREEVNKFCFSSINICVFERIK